ncbi:MAG: glycosyltransferase [bacterium]
MKKLKLLLISGIPLLPQNNGGATRLKNTLKYLSQKYEITFREVSVVRKSLWTSITTGIPYHMTNYYNPELRKLLENESFDEIRIEGTQLLYLAQFLPRDVPTTFVSLDISTVSFWRRAWESNNPFVVLLRLASCLQVYIYEKYYLKRFHQVVTMSKIDAAALSNLFGMNNILITPNGIDGIHFLPPRTSKIMTLGFIGSQSHTPNIAAINFITENILPALNTREHEYRVMVLGKFDKLLSENKHVEIIDHIDELRDFYSKIDFLVAPIYSGSGTRIKILESLSYGKPIITTEIGAEGIGIKSKLLTIIPYANERNAKTWVSQITKTYKSINDLSGELANLEKQLSPLTWENIFRS